MPFSLPAPSSLQDVFSMNPGAFYQGQQMLQGGMQQNQADLQTTSLRNAFDEQNNPQRLRAADLANQTTEAQLPGILAGSDMQGMNRDKQRALFEDSIKSARSKFASEATDAHLKELEDKGQEMAYSQDPQQREQGIQILMHHKEIIKEREKQKYMSDRQMQLEQQRGKNQQELAQTNNSAGRYSAKGSKGGGTIADQIASGKLNYERAATMYAGLAMQAEDDGDSEKAGMYRQQADQYNQMFIAGKRAGAQGAAESKADLNEIGMATNAPVPAGKFAPVGRKAPEGPDLTGMNKQQKIRALLDFKPAEFSSPEVEARVKAAAGSSAAQDNGTQFKQAFGVYEPDKYEYRIGPTGKPQRKLKGN